MKINNIKITLVTPKGGLIAFASLVLADGFYVSGIGIHEKLDGTGYRLTYPTRKVGGQVYGNNFEELDGKQDLYKLIKVLLKALKRMGVETSYDALLNAKISAIHYSKNILLDRNTPCHLLIQMLAKADMTARLDMNQSDFRNGGQMVKYHASTYEIVLYDKVKDLEQGRKYGAKRGAEIDYDCQHDLFIGQQAPEVLRLEIRLTSRKIK